MTHDGQNAAIDAHLQQAFAALRAASSPGHPSEDDWARFAADEMSPDERTQVADHVLTCAECADVFRVLSVVGSDARGVDQDVVRRSAFGDWRGLAAAAAVVLTIGLGAWWALRAGPDAGNQRAGDRPATSASASLRRDKPSVDARATPSALWAALPAAPEVRLPPDLVLAMRGVDGDRDGFMKAFGEAIAPYRAGRFADAAAALAPVTERYADVVEAWFYLGTSRLYSGAAADAIEPLRRAQGSTVVGDDARWLEAVALQRAGRDSEARAALQVLCSAAGQYRERACAVLKP